MVTPDTPMEWASWMQLPTTVLLVLGTCGLLFTLIQAVALRRRMRDRRHLAAGWRSLLLLLGLGLTLLLAGAGWTLRGYRVLGEEAPVVQIHSRILSPQHWALDLAWPDGSTREVLLDGDDWRLEAVVLKWKLPALLAGVPPLYRLDRLSGRYRDPVQERQAPRSVIDFNQAGTLDLLNLRRHYARWLPLVDTVYGSGVYLPLVDDGHYTVSLMRTGALVARADPATLQRADAL